MQDIKNILIVGGGTSGWITAAYLAKRLGGDREDGVKITLVESSNVPTIGVGEAGIPNLRELLKNLDIAESDFIRHCSATFKQGIKFTDWLKPPTKTQSHSYYHLFGGAFGVGGYSFAEYWLKNRDKIDIPYSYTLGVQSAACDAGMAPKQASDPDYKGALGYSYHFDAGLFSELLKKNAKKNGVHHLIADVNQAHKNHQGFITSLKTADNSRITADLFIDCTGFSGHLIEGEMGSEFTSCNDTLFVDRAMAVQIPYRDPEAPIPSFTQSTAMEAGWIWRIPLINRIGTGYVYSSKYTDDETAEQSFRDHIGTAGKDLDIRKLKMRVGYRKQPWIKNCIAVGLSAGFLEPLESTGIYLIQFAAERIASLLPLKGELSLAADRFNQLASSEYQHIIDFIKLHYCLTQRTDSEFWIDNARPKSIPDSLQKLLTASTYRVPMGEDFCHKQFCFHASNYHQVLYGMDFDTDIRHLGIAPDSDRIFWESQKRFRTLSNEVHERLPTNRALLKQLASQQPSPQKSPAMSF